MPPDFLYTLTESGMFIFILFATGLIAAAIHFLFYWNKLSFLAVADLSPVLQTLCGTLFVLSVTFLSSSVWQTEGRARELVNQEARSLRTIRTYMDQMTGPSHDGFLKLLSDYAGGTETEWPAMASAGASPVAEERLVDIYRAVVLGFSEGDLNRALQQRILAALDALSQARQGRLTMAKEQVSGGQWFTVTFMALLLLAVLAICHARAARARAIALSVITLAITVSLFVILAHDRPFIGHLAISPKPILDAAR